MNDRATLTAPATIRMERLLPGPLERVWAYLTESEKRARWFAGGEFELRVGGRIELQFDHNQLSSDKKVPDEHKGVEHSRYAGTITRLEPNRVLAYRWTMFGQDTEVTFELAARGKDVLLTITHTGLAGRDVQARIMGGWDVHSGILADVLNGVEPRPFWTTHAKLAKQYEAGL